MADAVRWIFGLVDQVSRPARNINGLLGRVEGTVRRVDGAARRLSGGGFGGMGRAGEASARRVERAWGRVDAQIRGMGQGIGDLQNQLGTLAFAAAPVVGAGYAGKAVLDMAGAREGALMSMGTLLKTEDQTVVRESVSWVDRFSDITPFQDQDVMNSVRQLLAAQFKFPEVRGLARVTGDAASALGRDPGDSAQKWEIINRALGQIRAKNRLQGDEVLQLNEAGIGTDKYLQEAFGPNYRKLQEAGRIPAEAAIQAIVAGLDKDFGGAMAKQSRTLFGLASTLKSRPQRLFGQLFDAGALDEPKRFFSNLVDLTDFSKAPGNRAMRRITQSGRKLSRALFGGLADATEGQQGEEALDRMLDRLDEYSAWWERNGPRLAAEGKGFGEGLKAAGDGAAALVAPLGWIAGRVDRLTGGDGEGMIGKMLGFGAGAVLLGRLGNFLTFGGLGALGKKAGGYLLGGLSGIWAKQSGKLLTRGLLGEILTNPGGRLAGARAAFASLGGRAGLGALLGTGLRTVPVIGWLITGATLLKGAGDAIYERWKPFADLIDRIREDMGWILKPAAEQTTPLGRALAFDPIKWVTGQPQAWEEGNTGFLQGVNDTAGRLGIRPEDLLKVMNAQSGLNPAARDRETGATGLLGFTEEEAKSVGTTTRDLGRMTREEQLPFVERLLRERGVRAGMGLEQLYAAGVADNGGETGTLWHEGAIEYTRNQSLDANRDGIITSREAVQKVEATWRRDAPRLQQQLHITIAGPVDQAAVDGLRNAAYGGTLGALQQLAVEGGWSSSVEAP